MPHVSLLATHSERLCLGLWRGILAEGAAAVFEPCPKPPRRTALRRAANDRLAAERAAQAAWRIEPDPSSPLGGSVRIVPRLAPHLCLGAPPILLSSHPPN